MYTWTIDISNTSERDKDNLWTCYRIMTGYAVHLDGNNLCGKCDCPSQLEGQSGIHFTKVPNVLDQVNTEGLDDGQVYFLREYLEELSKPLKITRHMSTCPNGKSSKGPLPDTIIHVKESFCDGYGNGVLGVVIFSPHTHLIGQETKLDGRTTDKYHINQYGTKL